jgi:PAS domain S-box-containing protein
MHMNQQQPGAPAGRSDDEFHRMLEILPAAAYTCDADGLITYFNQRATRLWGREPKLNDPVDRFCGSFKLFTPDGTPLEHRQCWMARALRDGLQYNGCEILVERPDGSRVAALAHANPFHDHAGRVRGAVNVLVDITDRKQSEELLRESDRRKSEFLALLAHELRNPLTPIRNGLQIMRTASHDAAMLEEACGMMERQLGHMVRLIDDLLDLSRICNGKIQVCKERIDLAAAVQDAVETSRPLIEESQQILTVSLPPRAVHVEADRTRLAQVVGNLLHNSAKYTPRGGRIDLMVERQGSDAVVSVKDNGVGIPADMLPGIFEMFIQGEGPLERSQGGLGIGLSLVRALVELHGGSIEARSTGPGQGSEFIMRLPAILPAPSGSRRGDDGDDSCRPHHRILVVDDNRDAALSSSMILKVMGHETRTAYDGLEALEAAADFRPDVILLDIGLPKLNGYEVCRQIRTQAWGEGMVLIAVTGWGQDEDKARSKEAGFNFHMVKPVDPAALEKLLSGLLLTPA